MRRFSATSNRAAYGESCNAGDPLAPGTPTVTGAKETPWKQHDLFHVPPGQLKAPSAHAARPTGALAQR